MGDKQVKLQALYSLIDYEPFVILIGLNIFAWIFYQFFLRGVSAERHKNIQNHFRNLFRHSFLFSVFFVVYKFFYQNPSFPGADRVLPYIAVLTFAWGALVFVKSSRLITLQYLFLGSMKAGVPVLIVNISSLMISLAISVWAASHIFSIQIGPLLATSAVFSIILGLALQDTLGNLFAGISLQIDKSFEIDDWLEITIGNNKISGQVKEITWRATVLTGWSDEMITVPNRTMASAHIANFHRGQLPILRSQIFRLPLNIQPEQVKKILLKAVEKIPAIKNFPEPMVFIQESTDSWLNVKLAYWIDSYGSQFSIGDQVIAASLKALEENGIRPAHQSFRIQNEQVSV